MTSGSGDLGALSSATTCRVITRGRRTGEVHAAPVWFAVGAEGIIYIPVRHGLRSDWLRNAVAARLLEVGHRKSRWTGRPHIVESDDELEVAVTTLTTKYARHGSIVESWRSQPPTIAAVVIES